MLRVGDHPTACLRNRGRPQNGRFALKTQPRMPANAQKRQAPNRCRQRIASHVARNDRTRKLSRQRTRPGARRSYVCPGGETSLSQIACSEDARFSEFGHFLPRGRRSGAFMPLPLADPACRKRSSHRTGTHNAMAKSTLPDSWPLERIGRGRRQASGKGVSIHPIARSGRNTRLSRFTSVLSSSRAMPRTAFILRMR